MRCFKGILPLFLFLFLYACEKPHTTFPFQNISLNDFDSLRNSAYVISAKKIDWYIDSLRLASHDTTFVDGFVNQYYANRSAYLWIDMRGADSRVDTLAHLLSRAEQEAVSVKTVFLLQISAALARLRAFDFTKNKNINLTLAEIEYFSTKAIVKYAAGMHFGFINPKKFMNALEKEDPSDTLNNKFRVLYAVPTETCDRKFLENVLQNVSKSSFVDEIYSDADKNANYVRLREEYTRKDLTLTQRRKLTVNMERCRWENVRELQKYIWINIPEFTLRAVDKVRNESLPMKVCVGSKNHKTPLLNGRIKRLELNPEWTVPQSIIRNEIAARHAEDEEYFERNQMRIIDKETNEEMLPAEVNADELKSGKYRVVQDKGDGNSLGRMIFRFDNDFAIYLHDTPNRQAFSRAQRMVSHGCIRVEKPLDLAVFLLEDKDSLVIDKIRIAIDLPPQTESGRKLAAKEDYKRMGLKTFNPEVPVLITYYTAYPDSNGHIIYTSDPYEYDDKIFRLLQTY